MLGAGNEVAPPKRRVHPASREISADPLSAAACRCRSCHNPYGTRGWRRCDAWEVADEVVRVAAYHVRLAPEATAVVQIEQKVEVLVRGDEGVNGQHRVGVRHVRVQFAACDE